MIVPELAASAAGELDDLRSACVEAVGRLLATGPDVVVVVGAAERTLGHGPDDRGSLRPYGLDRVLRLGPDGNRTGRAELPLSLLVGAWLLDRAGAAGPHRGQSVGTDTPVDECQRIGAELVEDPAERIGLLVMGDGSACRGERSPGYDDPRARPYDDRVAAALRDADRSALLGLEPELSTRLLVAGRAPWQVLAGAAARSGAPWRGDLTYYAAPYGVSYFVATWTPTRPDGSPGSGEREPRPRSGERERLSRSGEPGGEPA
ncbi:class III extradiol dioxygenase subunit B-like domain-containing protein [Plantactinospora sp. KLBMP9567]|uniref:class III extradiol dioxygenase subunit B-like domain-containing protein n=1 Tax=Plantactinospora sp. KLBMP9567 TaxID=3085900 RepID=UPI002981A1E4|nr:class III extradiol dioxygenase subunit B-like domain-containing protein [Plantactinospora sp. KLBMP9567]MDW5323839.1 class III extradiol dioxygenase subunit B-like domain-containing protein [Plantactinospora sp. KLBMP9567]